MPRRISIQPPSGAAGYVVAHIRVVQCVRQPLRGDCRISHFRAEVCEYSHVEARAFCATGLQVRLAGIYDHRSAPSNADALPAIEEIIISARRIKSQDLPAGVINDYVVKNRDSE